MLTSKRFQQMIFLGMVFLLLAGCAAQQTGEEPTAKIRPRRIYEECVKMSPGQVLQFSFTSSKPVDFNVHYHKGQDMSYPINEKQVTTLEGELDYEQLPAEDQTVEDLCVMWTNPHDDYVNLNYEVFVINKSE